MKKCLIAGLLVWLPIWATIVFFRFVINIVNNAVGLLPLRYQPDQLLGMHIPGIGLIIVFLLLFITGILVRNYFGRQLVKLWDEIIAKIPLIRTIYSAVKHLTHAIFNQSTSSFNKVLLVEYPRRGLWSIAFQTNQNFKQSPDNENLMTVFIPTTPNPTSGFLIMVPQDDVRQLDMSVEQAIRMVISLGVITPDTQT